MVPLTSVVAVGSSKAGRAWCHGASELRDGEGDGSASASPAEDAAARWDAEPWLALRVRRGAGVDGLDGVPGVAGVAGVA
ncbi:hypothetical protein HZS56_34035, partial [Streptomyces sp. A108]